MTEAIMTEKKGKIPRIPRITWLLLRELVRDNVFLTLSGAAVLLVLASLILNEMVVGQKIKATKDLGLSVMNLFSLFILIFSGVNLVAGDLGRKTLYFLFARPVKRWQYLTAAAFSLLLTVACGILVIMGTVFLLSFLQNDPWFTGLLAGGFLTLLEMMVMLSFALLFAVSTSPQLAMFLTLLMYVIGHTIEKAAALVETSSNLVLKYLVVALDGVLPNLEFFNKKAEIIHGVSIAGGYYFYAALYALGYSLLVFLLSVYVINRKEL